MQRIMRCAVLFGLPWAALAADPFRADVTSTPAGITWAAASGLVYRIETTTNLAMPDVWLSIGVVTGVGSQALFPFDTGAARAVRLAIATDPSEIIRNIASGGVMYARTICNAGTGWLPRNEAKRSELQSSSFSQQHFVPAQLFNLPPLLALSHAYRTTNAAFTAGLTTAELTNALGGIAAALTNILANHAFTNALGKALYQVHFIASGVAPKGSSFEQTVSGYDHGFIAGLEAAANYVRLFDPGLAARYDLLLTNFNMRMWYATGSMMTIGGPFDPQGGGLIDRIASEGRLLAVTARARNEITSNEFEHVIKTMRAQSFSTNDAGFEIEHLPYSGSALESVAATAYLNSERAAPFGERTLRPLLARWESLREQWNLPAVGASGIASGFVAPSFIRFVFPPREAGVDVVASNVVVLPAAVMALAVGSPIATQNVVRAYHAARLAGVVDPVYGFPNYLDDGSVLVNNSDPVFGTLEVEQATIAALNALLGQRYLEDLLRLDTGWSSALDHYSGLLSNRVWEAERDVARQQAYNSTRSAASGGIAVALTGLTSYVEYAVTLSTNGACLLRFRHSNDDTGSLDSVAVYVNNVLKGSIPTIDTGNGGAGWNVFTQSVALALGTLGPGPLTIRLQLAAHDGFGVEIDRIELVGP